MSGPSWSVAAREPGAGDGDRDSEASQLESKSAYFARKNGSPNRVPAVGELAADGIDVAVACRVLGAARSGFDDWRSRRPGLHLLRTRMEDTIWAVHIASRCR